MKGIFVKKIKCMHEDERRKIMEIMNGELQVKNLKILEVKESASHADVISVFKKSGWEFWDKKSKSS